MDVLEYIKKMQEMYGDDVITTADKLEKPPKTVVREIFEDFNARNPKADGGQLVAPSVDGSRPGYQGPDKYITPARRTGAEGFQGQKFISVKDPTYSDGRKRVKTPEYKKYLKIELEKSKKRPDRYKQMSNPRREPGLLRIAEAMQQADIYDDAEYMMPNKKAMKVKEKDFDRKMKVFKKGMLEAGDIVYITNLERNFDDVIFIADQLGESPDWVLDKLDERTNFRDFSRGEKDIMKKDPAYKKPRNDYLKVENWVQKNAKRYANPETFEKALIKRFGNKNQFVMDMKKGGQIASVHFSDGFKEMMLNSKPGSPVKSHHLKQFITSSLYNFNPKIKNAVTEEIKGIFNSKNLPKLRTEARKMLNNNKLLSKFGLNKAITGPYSKVIQAEIGQQMWDDITNFRKPRVGTQEMLKAFEQIVADEFKPMFNEAAKAIVYSKNNEWKKAKDSLGIADNIGWDHKVPSSVIDKGYADIIEYTKVNPTSANFNERIKNAQFDVKINRIIDGKGKYKGKGWTDAVTLDQKAKVVEELNKVKSNFNKKYGNYLDEVEIKLNKKGDLRFSSSAEPLTTKMDRVKMLQTSLQQEKFPTMSNKKQIKFLNDIQANSKLDECRLDSAEGGRIGFAYSNKCIKDGLEETKKKAAAGDKKAAKQLVKTAEAATKFKLLKNVLGPGAILGEAVFEGALIGNKILGGKPKDIAWAESYLSYLDPRKYRGELDPLKMAREDMLTREVEDAEGNIKTIDAPGSSVLRSGFAAQDQLSAANKAIEDRNIAKARKRIDQYLPAAADAREQAARANLSTKIISSDAFKDASRIAQEYLQGQTGANIAKYRTDDFGRFESGRDRAVRKRRMKEMSPEMPRDLLTAKTSDLLNYTQQLRELGFDVSTRDLMAEQDMLKSMPLSQAAEIYGPEQVYGTQGKFFASGGIANLTNTIPPKSGPMSQGLRSLYNNGRKL